MANSFQQRSYKVLARLVDYELDMALAECNTAARFGRSNKRAYNRLQQLSDTLLGYGRLGRRLAAEKGIPTDDEWEDSLHGGKGDRKTPSDFEKKDLEKGIKVEKEHTDDYDTALEIVMDHYSEFPPEEKPDYYDELSDMEKKLKDKKAEDEPMGTQTIGDNPLEEQVNEELSPTDKSLNAPSRRPQGGWR